MAENFNPSERGAFQHDVKIDVTGVKETLAELRKYDKELYKKVADELKGIAQPLAAEVGRSFPMVSPLQRWHFEGERRGKSRMPPYNPSFAARGVKPIVYTGNRFVGKNVGILRLQQMDAGGQVFDGAGSQSPRARMVLNLDKHRVTKSQGGGFRSRVMYGATKRGLPQIEDAIRKAIDDLNTIVVARIVSGY